MAENPLNFVADNQDNPFERAKEAVGEKVSGFFGSETGQKAVEKTEPLITGLSYIATPYREYAAPALSSVLLQLNSSYREQNKNLSFIDQMKRGIELSKQSVAGEDEYRRSVSPGRALVGLVGNIVPGKQGTDKINWADSRQVNDYFNSGSAQFWSGFADLGFNALDPVAFAAGKTAKVVRKGAINRPVSSRLTNPVRLAEEVNEAATNLNSNTGAAQIFKLVESDPDNIAAIQGYGFVAGSANPAGFAVALSEAHKMGGRLAMADVIKSSIGDIQSTNRLKTQYESVHALMQENAGRTTLLAEEQANINTMLDTRGVLSVKETDALLERKAKVKEAIDQAETAREEAAYKAGVLERTQEEFGINQTWSKSGYIERTRTWLAAAASDGIFLEIDPTKKFQLSRAVAREYGMSTMAARTVMWISPNQQLREVQSGIAYLGGAAGERSFLETDARISQIGRLTGMTKVEMKQLSNEYRTLRGKSERFNFLDNLQTTAFNGLLKKFYGKELGRMTPVQQEAASAFVRELIEGTRRAQARQVNSILERKYTVMDHTTGDVVAHQQIDTIVKNLAEQRANELGRPKTQADEDFVRRTLQQNQLTETQVPNVHFGVDIKMFDQIMSENPTLIKNVLNGILEEEWDAGRIRIIMNTAEKNALERSAGNASVYGDIKIAGKTALDVASDGIDQLYTYVWKPFTLLSFKYTTRNVFEGWLRMVASMVDFNSYYGYGYADMWTSVKEPGSISRTLQNRGIRKRSSAAQLKFNERLEDLRIAEGALSKQMLPTDKGTNIASKFKSKAITEADKKIFEGNDGIALTIAYAKNLTSKAMSTKSSGIKEVDATLRTIKDSLIPLLDGKGNYGSEIGNQFINKLTTGDYRAASEIAASASTGDILNALTSYRKEAEAVLAKLQKSDAAGAGTVSYMLDNSIYAISRMLVHTDITTELLVNRGRILGDIKELGSEIKGAGQKKLAFGEKKVKISNFNGGIYVDASLAGEAGDMLRKASSSKVSTTRVVMDERSVTNHGFMSNGFQRRPVSPYEATWTQAHADYVNNVMMRDGLIRTLVNNLAAGMSKEDAIAQARIWMKSTDPEANAWRREVKQNMTTMSNALDTKFSYEEQLQMSLLQIEEHLPSVSSITKQDYNLYKNASIGFTPEDSARINVQDRFEVSADREVHDKRLNVVYKNAVSGVFNMIGTLPEDHLVRHPFFNMVYNNEARRIAKKYERMGRANNMSEAQITELITNNLDKITVAAQNRAYKELMQRLYSVERYTGPAKMLRWVTPFYMAHQNSSRFWLGTSVRSPQVAYNLAKAYNAPYRLGLVQDEEGNTVSEGLPWSPDANKQKIIFNAGIIGQWTGRKTFTITPTGFDVITQGQAPILPTLGGPGGEIIGTQLIKYVTESTDADKFLREQFGISIDELSSKYILPFYEKGYGQSGISSAYSATVPFNSAQLSLLSSIYGMTGNLPIIQDLVPQVRQRWNARYDAARDEVVLQMQLNNEALDLDVINERAAKIARRSLLVESVSSGIGPVVAVKTDDTAIREMNQKLTRYQNEYGYNEGSAKLAAELDAQGYTDASGIVSTLRSSSSSNRFGLYSNVATVQGVQTNIDSFSKAAALYADNPFLGELFNVTGDGKYSQISDDLLYGLKVNGEPVKSKNMSPEDAERKAQLDGGWATYFDMLEYIRNDAEANGIKRGTDAYKNYYGVAEDRLEAYVSERYPAWATRDKRITLEKSDQFIALAQYFVNDKKFMGTVGKNNDVIKALEIYLYNREELVRQLEANRAASGVQGLDTNANQWYAEARDYVGEQLVAQYPEFKQMWTRYLSRDELNIVDSPLSNGVN